MLDSNERIKLMFDLSKEYEKDFLNQKDMVEEIKNIHLDTERFAKITTKEVKIIGKDLGDLVYAVMLYENSLYIHNSAENNQRQFFVFLSQEELVKHQKENNDKVIYLKFDDLLWLVENYQIDLVVTIMTNYTINFMAVNLFSFVNDGVLDNINRKATYVVGATAEKYDEVIKEMSDEFKKYSAIKEVYLYHVLELKDKTEDNENEENELMYNVMVVDMPYDGFFHVRDYIMKLVEKNNKEYINVIPKATSLGEHLVSYDLPPIFINQ